MKIFQRTVALLLLFGVSHAVCANDATTLTWHGHAAFEIVTPNNKVLMIDPWLKNPMNPNAKAGKAEGDKAPVAKDPLAAITKVDYILITHGHFDHLGDAVELAKKTGARLVTNYELGANMAKLLGYPKSQMGYDTLMNIGGSITIAGGEVIVDMVPAVHSSGMGNPLAGEEEPDVAVGGNPAGFIIRIKNGPTIYHTGDTAYFSDMVLISDFAPDVALINIGGHFGMEPAMAVRAAKTVHAKLVIPQHYGTFPVLTPDAKGFADEVQKAGMRCKVMQPGTTLAFKGKKLVSE